MASSTSNIQDGSDTKCKESCGLKYGISQNFHQNVIEQQKTKASKALIQPQIFDDPNAQEKFKHMMHDVVLKTFNDEFGKKIFKKAFEGMESNYPEILHGSEEYMFYCPTAFNFDSRIAANETSAPKALEQMQVSLESKQNSNTSSSIIQQSVINRNKVSKTLKYIKKKILPSCFQEQLQEVSLSQDDLKQKSSLTQNEEAQLKIIKSHLRKLRPQLAEQEFIIFKCT